MTLRQVLVLVVRLYACTAADGRRVVRQRKVSTKIASVTDADRRNAATARLEALETDHDTAPTFQDSDEEFVLEDSDDGSPGTWTFVLRELLSELHVLYR